MLKSVFITSINDNLEKCLSRGFEWIDWESIVRPGSRVFIKPNLTFPFYKPGVSTSPEMIEAVVSVLKKRTEKIFIGESDGAGSAWTVEEAFEGHQIPRICEKHRIQMINLSVARRERVEFKLRKKTIGIDLPKPLLTDTDVFVTMPVPKIHSMTKVSLGLKNQWGCIPFPERFRYHAYFDELVCSLNQVVIPRIIVGDCSHMLTGNGPMFGKEVKKNMLVVSNDIGSFELTMLHVMGVSHWSIGHINVAKGMGIVPKSMDEISFNTHWGEFADEKFFLERTIQNYIALLAFRDRFLTWLGYESPVAGFLHKILYAVKGNPLREAMEQKQRNAPTTDNREALQEDL